MSMPRPTIHQLLRHYPSTWDVSREELFISIGWAHELSNPAFLDTCAIRGSIGLLGCGVPLKGRMKILAGPYKGAWVEPGQARLSRWLAAYWGDPEKMEARAILQLAGRAGVVSHFNINPASPIAQGHFDVLAPTSKDAFHCASLCHWTSAETWFWALPS